VTEPVVPSRLLRKGNTEEGIDDLVEVGHVVAVAADSAVLGGDDEFIPRRLHTDV